jgi:hypothetical protein
MNVELFYTIVTSLVVSSAILNLSELVVDWFWNIRDRRTAKRLWAEQEEILRRLDVVVKKKPKTSRS